ncbi:MAG: archease [Nanoarchaeota archaeon]|nr:archease [Nanoarchaeota archaeon]
MINYKFLEHTADIKFRAYGKTLNAVFENCALAFSDTLSRGKKIKSEKKKTISLEGKDNESLLYNFLEELIYLLDAEYFVVSKAKVKIKDNKLNGVIYGDRVDNYKDLDHIKAATYAEMYIKKRKDGKWEAQVVLDV